MEFRSTAVTCFSTAIAEGSAFYKVKMLLLLTLPNLTVSFQNIYRAWHLSLAGGACFYFYC